MIKEFQGTNRWLSNFALVPIVLDGVTYPSVEHAYMSEKSKQINWKAFCADPSVTPEMVKIASRNIDLIENWDAIKLGIMENCIRKKFNQEPFKTRLLSTGNQNIQEGNNWGDKYWGICLKTGDGENHLGRLIMKIRDELNRQS